MKKRMLSMLLAIVMVCSLLPTMVFAEERETTHTNHCICGATHKDVGVHAEESKPTEWKPISSAADFTKNKDSGYYYLTTDIEVSAKWDFTQSRNIVLCLNGHDITYTGSSNVSFIPGSTALNFTLTDCQAEAGSILGFKNTYGGAINVKKEFTMYNGKITGNIASQGGGVYVDQNATFYMYGGEITGNTASSLGGGVFIKGSMEVAGAPVVNSNGNSNTGTSYQNKMSAYAKNIYSSNDAVVVGNGGLTAGAQLDITPKFPVSSSESPAAVATIAKGCTSDLSGYFTYTSGFNYTKQYDATAGEVQLVYAPVKYTVTFNMQGHGTQVEEQSVETDTYATAPYPAPTAAGYTFGGWYTTPECGYWDDYIFDFIKVKDNKTLYAKWTPTTYTITYHLDGGTVSTENPTTYTVESAAITLTNPTKDGYLFAGWTGTGLAAATTEVAIATGSTGNREYTATWTENTPTPPVYYPASTPTPSVKMDVEDATLNDAAKAVGSAVKNGSADITPAEGYTRESIAQLQRSGDLNLVIEKNAGYDDTEKKLLDDAITAKGGAAGSVMYLEINALLMTDDGKVVAQVNDTIIPMTITVDLTAEMQQAAKDGKRICVTRAHEGKVSIIDGTLNGEKTTFTFDSSKFSTYAIVALDGVVSPKTFDGGIALYAAMSVLAATGSAVVMGKKREK